MTLYNGRWGGRRGWLPRRNWAWRRTGWRRWRSRGWAGGLSNANRGICRRLPAPAASGFWVACIPPEGNRPWTGAKRQSPSAACVIENGDRPAGPVPGAPRRRRIRIGVTLTKMPGFARHFSPLHPKQTRFLLLFARSTEKDEPQPQVEVAVGFLMTNWAPSRSSL